MGYLVLGLDGEAEHSIDEALEGKRDRAVALVLGAEGPGLRQKTKETVDQLRENRLREGIWVAQRLQCCGSCALCRQAVTTISLKEFAHRKHSKFPAATLS